MRTPDQGPGELDVGSSGPGEASGQSKKTPLPPWFREPETRALRTGLCGSHPPGGLLGTLFPFPPLSTLLLL